MVMSMAKDQTWFQYPLQDRQLVAIVRMYMLRITRLFIIPMDIIITEQLQEGYEPLNMTAIIARHFST